MRVTDASAYDAMRTQVMKARTNAVNAQNTASSGLRVQKPSDDPMAAANARRESSRLALAQGGVRNTDTATMMLEGADSALGDVAAGLTEARSLAVEGSTSGLSAENRRALGIQVRKIREQMVTTGNTNVGGKYVFAGFRDNSPAFENSGTFLGDESSRDIQVLPNVTVPTSVNGRAVFGSGADSVFNTLDSLATALENGDIDAVRSSIVTLGLEEDRVLSVQSQVGAMQNRVTTARSVADRSAVRSQNEIARLVEADPIAAATDLVQARTALESAIAVAQQIPVGGLAGGR